MAISGVRTLHRIMVMGKVHSRTYGFEGTLLSEKFFERRGLARFLARGSRNDYSLEPTPEEVSSWLAKLCGENSPVAVTYRRNFYARGSGLYPLKRHYYECEAAAFWAAGHIREAMMSFTLVAGQERVQLLGPHEGQLLGVVDRQLVEILRPNGENAVLKAA